MNPKAKGEITVSVILAELVKRKVQVLLPWGDNQRYDLIIDSSTKGFLKIQCKTGRYRNGAIVFNTRSVQCNMNKTYVKTYIGQIDYFATWCPELPEHVYFFPISTQVGAVALRINPNRNGNRNNIIWAKDHILDKSINDFI